LHTKRDKGRSMLLYKKKRGYIQEHLSIRQRKMAPNVFVPISFET
jgi:hypothetical protein